MACLFSLFQRRLFQNLTQLFFTFLTRLLPLLFCHASFSPRFTAAPRGSGTCLLTLSPEGSGFTMSKYVHAKVTPAEGKRGLFVGVCMLRWELGGCVVTTRPPLLLTTAIFPSRASVKSGDRCFLTACSVAFTPPSQKRPSSYSPTECPCIHERKKGNMLSLCTSSEKQTH